MPYYKVTVVVGEYKDVLYTQETDKDMALRYAREIAKEYEERFNKECVRTDAELIDENEFLRNT